MKSPSGWIEPGQTPEFDEYTIVLYGTLRVKTKTGSNDVAAGQAIVVTKGEWVQVQLSGTRRRQNILPSVSRLFHPIMYIEILVQINFERHN